MLAFAAASTRFRSSWLNRTGTMLPLASFFASLGRPGFLVLFGTVLELLYDCGFYSRFGRYHGWDVKYGNVSFRVLWIVSLMDPSVNSVRSGMTVQVENLNNPIPNRLILKGFLYRHTFQVFWVSVMQMADHVLKFHDMCWNHLSHSNNSPTLQNVLSTPAAIAGVHLRVL